MDQGVWMQYAWTKPKSWYNQLRVNFNGFYSRLVTPLDEYHGKDKMYQSGRLNINANAQSKKLWFAGMNVTWYAPRNDFYEPRLKGRVFSKTSEVGLGGWWESNSAKRISYGGQVYLEKGGVFQGKSADMGVYGKVRFNSKFSVDLATNIRKANNEAGWADNLYTSGPAQKDTVMFSRRSVVSVENILSLKYNFTNRMGVTMRTRHYWSKVDPAEFYVLEMSGELEKPGFLYDKNLHQNYNYLTVDMVYTWQFAQGSFFNIVWKGIGEDFTRTAEHNYFKNLGTTVSGPQFNSLSLRVIYFLDYLTLKTRKV